MHSRVVFCIRHLYTEWVVLFTYEKIDGVWTDSQTCEVLFKCLAADVDSLFKV